MSELPALLAVYSDIKVVKTRGAVQLIFELPLEEMKRAIDLLGAPVADKSVWVGIARVDLPGATADAPDGDGAPQIANDDQVTHRPLSQVAGALCNIGAFRRFIMEQYKGWNTMPTVDEAADWVREQCGVQSRRELDTDDVAAANFRNIRSKYWAWMEAA